MVSAWSMCGGGSCVSRRNRFFASEAVWGGGIKRARRPQHVVAQKGMLRISAEQMAELHDVRATNSQQKIADYLRKVAPKAPPAHSVVAPIGSKKLEDSKTKRIWKVKKPTAKGAYRIRIEEGAKHTAYNDAKTATDSKPPNGNATIGIGHLLHGGAVTEMDKQLYWDDAKIDSQFQEDVENSDYSSAIHVPLYPREFEALLDLTFNAGAGAITEATNNIPIRLNWGRYLWAAEYLRTHYRLANGDPNFLTAKRQRDYEAFTTEGAYPVP